MEPEAPSQDSQKLTFCPYRESDQPRQSFLIPLLKGLLSFFRLIINFFQKAFPSFHIVWGRNEVTEEWRKLHNEELNDLYCSPNIVRVIKWRILRWAGHVARMGERRGLYRVLVGKPEGKRPPGRPGCRCEDNIKTDL